MTFKISKSILVEALTIAGKSISKGILPILDNYLFQIDHDKLTITGSNLEISLSVQLEISGTDFKRDIAVPASRLSGLVKALPEQLLQFVIDEKPSQVDKSITLNLNIISDKGTYIIPIEDGTDFPMLKNSGDVSFTMASADFVKGIDKTLFACSVNVGAVLNGLLISFEGNEVTYTGTTGHSLSTFSFPIDLDSNKQFIVPSKVLAILQSTPMEDQIKIAIDDKNIVFEVQENVTVRALLIDGVYPDYKRVIPTDQNKQMTIDRTELLGSLKRINQFADSVTHQVVLTLSEKECSLKSRNDFGENAKEDLGSIYTGDPIAIAFNGNLLQACLSRLQADEINISFSENSRPMIIHDEHSSIADKKNIMLVMPLAL